MQQYQRSTLAGRTTLFHNVLYLPLMCNRGFHRSVRKKGLGLMTSPSCAEVLCSRPGTSSSYALLGSAGGRFFPALSEVWIHCPHCKIWKSGDRCDVQNYRQITILSAIAKVFDIIVLDHSYFHLRKCISPEHMNAKLHHT